MTRSAVTGAADRALADRATAPAKDVEPVLHSYFAHDVGHRLDQGGAAVPCRRRRALPVGGGSRRSNRADRHRGPAHARPRAGPGCPGDPGARRPGGAGRADLPRLLAEIDACGLPDTLVHGDLHPGNWRRGGANLTLLDWGRSRIGNPALDLRAFVERIADAGQQERARSVWADAWRRQVHGCDPARAVELIEPVAQLGAATAYQHVLDHIEQTEQPYHALDPDERLRAALAACG